MIIGLANGLSQLADGDEEYLFLTYADSQDWILPHLHGPCRTLAGPAAPAPSRVRGILKTVMPELRKVWHHLGSFSGQLSLTIARSDGTVEGAGADIMHFTGQYAFLTSVPSIYHPHDLQHRHLPELFSSRDRFIRDSMYKTYCDQAEMVAVASSWVKRDLIQQYQLSANKICVVPLAPASAAYPTPTVEDIVVTREKYGLPESFVFYPAQTWPHKNHIGLLEALSIIRSRFGIEIPAVFSGCRGEFFPRIQQRLNALHLDDQAHFLGFVSPLELQCLYKLCRCVVIPTKFEAASFPLWEAFLAGAPAACSNVTSLPEQAGDSALIFDPDRPEQIADAIYRLWMDAELRRILVQKGTANVSRFTWDRTARTFRAHYRRIANRSLTEEDRELVSAPLLL